MPAAIDKGVGICGVQGWLDRQIVQGVVLLNLVGGDCVTDIDKLEGDKGLCELARSGEYAGMLLHERRAADRRFRAGRTRTFAAPTQIYGFLEACHSEEEEARRAVVKEKAFIPKPNEHLKSRNALNTTMVAQLQKHSPQKTATLDCDAALVPTDTKTALFSYKHFRAYQPYNVWWAEQKVVLRSQFRDGNVPAGFNILPVLQDAIASLPEGVEKVYMRQDTAACQTDVPAWCEREREHPQYGRIHFTISADITDPLRDEIAKVTDSTDLANRDGKQYPEREWAEVNFVPNAQAVLTDIFEPFGYIVIRERIGAQLRLLDLNSSTKQADKSFGLPFPVITLDNMAYKIAAIVTNRRTEAAPELIAWHYERCGKSEEVHSVMKSDFAGGQLPSSKFGANAAWWALMILAVNFQSIMKQLILGSDHADKRMKAIRYTLIHTAGRIVHHSRRRCLRMSLTFHDWLSTLREAIAKLTPVGT
jgi:hypothetical protein